MIDIHPFTDEQYYQLCECNCSMPVPLHEADLTKPFVYDRKYGVFYVPSGLHQLTMATLLAFHHGLIKPLHLENKLETKSSRFGISVAADYWLEHTQGAAFKSSVSPKIQIGRIKNINYFERRFFKDVSIIFE